MDIRTLLITPFLSLRKENKNAEARQAFVKSLELNPNRIWVKQQLNKTPIVDPIKVK